MEDFDRPRCCRPDHAGRPAERQGRLSERRAGAVAGAVLWSNSFTRAATFPGRCFATTRSTLLIPARGPCSSPSRRRPPASLSTPAAPKQKAEGAPDPQTWRSASREAAFKDIDVKGSIRAHARAGRRRHVRSQPRGSAHPATQLAVSQRSRREPRRPGRTVEFAHIASRWFDGCGLYAYGHKNWDLSSPTRPSGFLPQSNSTECSRASARATARLTRGLRY